MYILVCWFEFEVKARSDSKFMATIEARYIVRVEVRFIVRV